MRDITETCIKFGSLFSVYLTKNEKQMISLYLEIRIPSNITTLHKLQSTSELLRP